MICRVTGRILLVRDEAVVVESGDLAYEVLVPRSARADLQRLHGGAITLFTIQFIEGNPAMGHLAPRLVGFLSEVERDFYTELTKVKGLGMRKALRAMSVPAAQIAAAIEAGDTRALSGLPEIGTRTAAQVIAHLRGKVQRFLVAEVAPAPVAEMSAAQLVALDILVHWGDRRADAQRWVTAAVEADAGLTEPDQIVRAAYRIKNAAGRQP